MLKPLISIAAIITEVLGVYCSTSTSFAFANIYLEIVDFVSVTIALYGLVGSSSAASNAEADELSFEDRAVRSDAHRVRSFASADPHTANLTAPPDSKAIGKLATPSPLRISIHSVPHHPTVLSANFGQSNLCVARPLGVRSLTLLGGADCSLSILSRLCVHDPGALRRHHWHTLLVCLSIHTSRDPQTDAREQDGDQCQRGAECARDHGGDGAHRAVPAVCVLVYRVRLYVG